MCSLSLSLASAITVLEHLFRAQALRAVLHGELETASWDFCAPVRALAMVWNTSVKLMWHPFISNSRLLPFALFLTLPDLCSWACISVAACRRELVEGKDVLFPKWKVVFITSFASVPTRKGLKVKFYSCSTLQTVYVYIYIHSSHSYIYIYIGLRAL